MIYDLFLHFVSTLGIPTGIPESVWEMASNNDSGIQPTIYTLGACYMEIFIGLGNLQAIIYRATPTRFQILDQDSKLLKESVGSAFHQAHIALWCIGKFDPIIPKYLNRFQKDENITFLEFQLDEADLEQFSSFKLHSN